MRTGVKMGYNVEFSHSEKTLEITEWLKENIGYGGVSYFLGEYDWYLYISSNLRCTLGFKDEKSKMWFMLVWGELI